MVGCVEGSTEDDVTDTPMHTESVHRTHPPSPPPPPSSPTHSQGAEHSTTHEATVVGELYYPSDKSRDQHDIEQGNIDYTGKDSFENLVLSALDRRLEDSERGD